MENQKAQDLLIKIGELSPHIKEALEKVLEDVYTNGYSEGYNEGYECGYDEKDKT